MHQQHPKRIHRRPWILLAAIGAAGVLLVGIVATAGYLEYRQLAPDRGQYPAADPLTVAAPGQGPAPVSSPQPEEQSVGPLPPPPPEPSVENIRASQQLVQQRLPAQQAPRQHSTDDLIAAVDKAFAEPAAEMKPAVVFLPVVDGAGQVRPDGGVLGQMAAFAAVYTPHRRLALSTPFHWDELAVAGCLKPGVRLEPGMIALCTAALETKLYILPSLESADGKHELTVEFHGDGKAYPNRTFRHEVPAEGLRTVPGLVARDALEALGVGLDAAELQTVLEPDVRNDQELGYLNQLLRVYPATASEDSWLGAFLNVNTRCALGWDQYLTNGRNVEASTVLKHFALAQPPCDRLKISAARLQRNAGHGEDALLALLKLASSHRGDTAYHATLTQCAIALGDERLANHLFEVWENADAGYAGCLDRGGRLIEWGWMARGEGAADTVTAEGWKLFRARLLRARAELEKAVQRNPSGCRAHVGLMQVARALGLPREFMEEHFRQAVRAQPHLLLAYIEKWDYLRPRWNGDAEELLAFGKECLATSAWDDGIPPLCLSAIRDVCSGMSDDTLLRGLAAGGLWDLLRAYDEAAEQHGGPAVAVQARNVFARLGVVGGHFDEVAPAYQKLEETGVPDSVIFVDQGEYDYFCDLVQAHTGKLSTRQAGAKRDRALAGASVALAAGDLDEAEKDLGQVEHGDAANDRLAERYRGAIALGRKLQANGSVTLSPQQVKDVCVPENEQLWTVEGDGLTGRVHFGHIDLVLPLGLRDAIVTGALAWEGQVSRVEMQLHARSPRHKGRMVFFPDQEQVHLWSDHVAIAQAPYRPGPQRFHLELGDQQDRLEPSSGIPWRLPADDLPGSLALNLWATAGDATLTISDLRIEQQK